MEFRSLITQIKVQNVRIAMENGVISYFYIQYTVWCINPYPVELNYLNFYPLKVVFRYRDPQL